MGSRKHVRPSPPPSGPALARPLVGALLVTLAGAVELGCGPKGVPPMVPPDPPMPDPSGERSMDSSGLPPMPNPEGGVTNESTNEPPEAPMPPPE